MAVGRLVRSIVGCVALAAGFASAFAADEVYVSNYYGGSIHIYPRTTNGDIEPTRTIGTGLSLPHDVAVDLLHRELFVPNNQPAGQIPAVNAYDLDAGMPGVGDAPKRTISGPATLLARPAGLAVDSVHQELYVANDVDVNAPILVFPLSADGNVAPTRVLQGPLTTLRGPMGLALDLVHNELLVVSYKVDDEGSITTFPRTAQGNVAPTRTIQGPLTGFNRPQALVLDLVHNELIVANSFFDNTVSLGGLLVFPRAATGNVAPIRQITGGNTALCNPIGMTFDRVHDEIYVTNAAANSTCQPSVVVFARSASGNATPLRKIGPGPNCDLNNPEGVAVITTVDCTDPLVAPGTPCDDGDPCTGGDACGSGACNAGTTSTVPGELQGMTADPDRETFGWTPLANATRYDVVRGGLASLGVGPGGGDEVCFDDLTVTSIDDNTLPASNAGFWYVARGANACGAGTYGTRHDGTPRITTTCP
jgi:DNA-binding beta-propeller fold protein YncE